jgi:hypothetical protein
LLPPEQHFLLPNKLLVQQLPTVISVKFAIVMPVKVELVKDVNKHPKLTLRKLQVFSLPILQVSLTLECSVPSTVNTFTTPPAIFDPSVLLKTDFSIQFSFLQFGQL